MKGVDGDPLKYIALKPCAQEAQTCAKASEYKTNIEMDNAFRLLKSLCTFYCAAVEGSASDLLYMSIYLMYPSFP